MSKEIEPKMVSTVIPATPHPVKEFLGVGHPTAYCTEYKVKFGNVLWHAGMVKYVVASLAMQLVGLFIMILIGCYLLFDVWQPSRVAAWCLWVGLWLFGVGFLLMRKCVEVQGKADDRKFLDILDKSQANI